MVNLKFRAWDKVSETMHKVEGIRFGINGARVISLAEMNRYNNNHTRWHTDVELLQSTGLKDKNGVEIYEGDVLELPVAIDTETLKGEVVFEDGVFGIKDVLYGWGFEIGLAPLIEIVLAKKVVIVGNIYEHPYLLEE